MEDKKIVLNENVFKAGGIITKVIRDRESGRVFVYIKPKIQRFTPSYFEKHMRKEKENEDASSKDKRENSFVVFPKIFLPLGIEHYTDENLQKLINYYIEMTGHVVYHTFLERGIRKTECYFEATSFKISPPYELNDFFETSNDFSGIKKESYFKIAFNGTIDYIADKKSFKIVTVKTNRLDKIIEKGVEQVVTVTEKIPIQVLNTSMHEKFYNDMKVGDRFICFIDGEKGLKILKKTQQYKAGADKKRQKFVSEMISFSTIEYDVVPIPISEDDSVED